MECKSIQISSSSSSTTRVYDVFVSFRGEDVRNSFVDHLFAAFQRKGIVAYRDDTNLKQGEHISTELVQAIEGSQVLIVVFSKNYATSTWCLQELAKIVDCMKVSTGQRVLPVFYDVSPSEVRKQSGDYGKAFAELEKRFNQDLGKVQRWRKALVQVADLSGWDVQNQPQYEKIEKIVGRVNTILSYKLSSDPDGLVGMYSRVEQLEKLLDLDTNDDVRFVGICGMGGIGKTTLARAVYDRNFHQYGASCFIDDISEVFHNGGLAAAQKQLICQTLDEDIQDIWNLSKANRLIKTRLSHLKTLVVLDNVDKVEQLAKLGLNRDYLCAGSRIVVISRDRHILNEYGVDEVYEVQLLNMDEARILFCRKAFKNDYIMSCDDISREYEELTDLALEYAQCLPLAIEVLGSFLYGRDISEWRSALARLRDNPKKEIMDVLQISFDGLESMEKEIFLDIACFFNNNDEKYVKRVLDCCGFHPIIGIRVLVDKSLITINFLGNIEMHDKLRELGMKIVKEKAPNEPGKWSRIWCHEDFLNVMSEKMAMDNLKATRLGSQRNTKENATLRAEVLSRMNQLRLLILKNVTFSGSVNCLSSELQYLEWVKYPFTYFPSSCELIKLVKLILPYSSIKQLWKGTKPLYNLKIMDLRYSENLVKSPDFSGAPNLKKLILEGCTKLVHIHPSIGLLRKLVHLNLANCTSLMTLPNSILGVSSLEVVNLRGCSKLFQSELLENARHGISDTSIQCQSTFSIFKRLKLMLPLPFFNSRREHSDKVGSLMPSLARFYCLRQLDLSFCNLFNVPDAMASLYCLEMLDLAGNNFVTLPFIIKELPRLLSLKLDHCKQLTSLSEFPLRALMPVRKELVCSIDNAGLGIFNCPKLADTESWSSVALSWMIQFLKVHKESSPPLTIVIPGTQIPSWFNTQGVGDSMRIEPFPNVQDSNWIGFAFCATFVTQYDPLSSSDAEVASPTICCSFDIGSYGRFHRVAKIILTDGDPVELVHLCLVYFTRQELKSTVQWAKPNIHDFNGCSCYISCHYFQNLDHVRLSRKPDVRVEMKHWGIRTVFQQDLEELNGDQ